MASRKKRLKHDDYSVGLIYVKPLEMDAIIPMLDEEHESLPLPEQDHNEYTLGKIGPHNVIIVGPPPGQQGKVAIASVVGRISYTFKNVKMGLLVGIGGGVPRPGYDVRLGDVVVGAPEYGPAVVQYDLGKWTTEGTIEVTRTLNKPPTQLLNVVTKVKSQYLRLVNGQESFFTRHLQRYENFPNLKDTYSRPSVPDRLFISSFIHETAADCKDHDAQYLVQRDERQEDIRIHYSSILSGDLVMKCGETRDRLSVQHYNALCFEMEAAGLMDIFPSLVVRGICDYCDSHKSKEWQGYAAATAAAYARELLCVMTERTVEDLASAISVHDDAEGEDSGRRAALSESQEKDRIKFLQTIAFPEMENRESTVESAYLQTYEWLRASGAYKNWLSARGGKLLIKGKAGCGKSTLMKFLYKEEQNSKSNQVVCGFFFNNRGTQFERTTTAMLRTIIHQMIFQNPTLFSSLQSFYADRAAVSQAQNRRIDWTNAQLENMFTTIVSSPDLNGLIYIDALDEGEGFIRSEMFEFLENQLANKSRESNRNLRICLSSRPDSFINRRTDWTTIDLGEENSGDMTLYITEKLRRTAVHEDQADSRYTEIIPELTEAILRKANGVFLWAKLVVERLQEAMNDGEANPDVIQSILEESPSDLYELFLSCLKKVNKRYRNKMKEILQIVLVAERPLSVDELFDLIRTVPESQGSYGVTHSRKSKKLKLGSVQNMGSSNRQGCSGVDSANRERQDMKINIQNWCGGLVEVISTSRKIRLSPTTDSDYFPHYNFFNNPSYDYVLNTEVRFMHQSVKDFLQEHAGSNETLPKEIGGNGHRFLFSRCVQYLEGLEDSSFYNDFGVRNLDDLDWAGSARDRVDWKGMDKKHPFLVYSGYWVWHAENYAKRDPNACKTELQLINKKFQGWAAYCYGRKPSDKKDRFRCFADGRHLSSLLRLSAFHQFHILVELLLDSDLDFEVDVLNEALRSACESIQATVGSRSGYRERGTEDTEDWWLKFEKIVKILIKKGAGVDVLSYWGTPLVAAVYGDRQELVEWLLVQGANINLVADAKIGNSDFCNPLIAACCTGNIPMAKFLIRNGAEVDPQTTKRGSALAEAAYRGYINLVKFLLDEGAIIDRLLEDAGYGTALMHAAGKGQEETVRFLVSRGASVNLQGSGGSPLSSAACSIESDEGFSTMKYLIQKGADVNAVLENGIFGSALISACWAGDERSMFERVELLVEHGVDVNLKVKCGEYGSALAALPFIDDNDGNVTRYLIEQGARVNDQLLVGDCGSALIAAAAAQSVNKMKILIEAGADVNLLAQSGIYRSALKAAVSSPDYQVHGTFEFRMSAIQLLLDHGAEVDEVLRTDQVPPEYLEIILPYAKDPELITRYAKVVRDYAEKRGFNTASSEDKEDN